MRFLFGVLWVVVQLPDSFITEPIGGIHIMFSLCRPGTFRCIGSHHCMPNSYMCDGDSDCRDKGDEANCSKITCPFGGYLCPGESCIPASYVCDGDSDCPDKSDEANCTLGRCSEGSFECQTGECVLSAQRCDGKRDCLDGSDEYSCNSTAATNATDESCSGFRCLSDKRCIQREFRCDGDVDCVDGSDEMFCLYRRRRTRPCTGFVCRSDKRCVHRSAQCDDERDCIDASDEENCPNKNETCPANRIRCRGTNSTFCIPNSFICDGDNDCLDGSDERNCTTHLSHNNSSSIPCPLGTFNCYEGSAHRRRCIPFSFKCDGDQDCPNAFDEQNCQNRTVICAPERFACAHGLSCVPNSFVCDGANDCNDNSDEQNCNNPPTNGTDPCPLGYMNCYGGSLSPKRCIRSAYKCDGDQDCRNGYDEQNCTTIRRTIGHLWGFCPPSMFTCNNGMCTSRRYVCDGDRDCSDGSDEVNCTTSTPVPTTIGCINGTGANCSGGLEREECESGILCEDGRCISEQQRCNYILDCADGRDEANCTCHPLREFRCSNGRCIPRGLICDLANDCGDNSDESPSHCGHLPGTQTIRPHCESNEFMCANRQCIAFSHVCNGRRDCTDGSDEGGHCLRSDCKSSPCHQMCHESPNGYRCSCRSGFQLADDRHSCEDINECSNGVCEHYCQNTVGSYVCSCQLGYTASADGHNCSIDETKVVLLFAEAHRLRSVVAGDTYATSDLLSTEDVNSINGLAFDNSLTTLYWSKPTGIWKMSVQDGVVQSAPQLVPAKLSLPSHLSVDWITHNIYVVNERRKLAVCNADLSRCAALAVPEKLNEIKSLTLAVNAGLMFFSYWSGDMGKSVTGGVIRAQMDGTNQREILVNMTMKPSHLQIEFVHRRLYVFDQHLQTIEHFDFNGNDRKLLYQGHQIHAFALSPTALYWSEKMQIFKGQSFNASRYVTISPMTSASVMTITHPISQPAERNPCSDHHCEHLCLRTAFGAVCACDMGFTLNANGRTCSVASERGVLARLGVDPSFGCSPPCSNGGSCMRDIETGQAICMCASGFSGDHCERRNGPPAIWIFAGLVFIVLLTGMALKVVPKVYEYTSTMYRRGVVPVNAKRNSEMESTLITSANPNENRLSCELNEL